MGPPELRKAIWTIVILIAVFGPLVPALRPIRAVAAGPVNPVLAGYFSKVVQMLINRKQK